MSFTVLSGPSVHSLKILSALDPAGLKLHLKPLRALPFPLTTLPQTSGSQGHSPCWSLRVWIVSSLFLELFT